MGPDLYIFVGTLGHLDKPFSPFMVNAIRIDGN